MPDHGTPAADASVALRSAEASARHGVTATFGQSLPSAFHLASPHAGIQQTVYHQENMGGTMADGYARISHKAGIVTAQNGPAATLLVPAGLLAEKAGRTSPRQSSLGWGVPLAIGAQVAAPESWVVCLCGDGGFGHSWAELETLRRLKVPVTAAVLNNGIPGFQKHGEDTILGDHAIACDFADVDLAAFASNEPNLIEAITDPNAKPPLTCFHGHYPEPF